MSTVADLLRSGRETLRSAKVEQPGREAMRLLGFLLSLPEAGVLARDRDPVPAETGDQFRDLVERRAAGEPLAYLLGSREFYGRRFRVDDRVLIPRPETEHLVEVCLSLPLPDTARVLDVGTGSGCIAATLAAERPDWRVVASDLSPEAIAVAHLNARQLGVDRRVLTAVADLAAAFDLSRIDLVVANVPYVEEEVVPHLSRDVRDFEPRLALAGGPDGLAPLRRLLGQLERLREGAWVGLEFGFGQADPVRGIVTSGSGFTAPEIHRDLAGIERHMVFRKRR